MTINDTWGYKSYDTNFKSTETLLHNLIDIASKGGNYLLNVGPDSHGIVPQPEADRLRAMGAWLAVNGEAIYGTQPTLFGAGGGRVQRHREGQERQAEVGCRVELALHHRARQDLSSKYSTGPRAASIWTRFRAPLPKPICSPTPRTRR